MHIQFKQRLLVPVLFQCLHTLSSFFCSILIGSWNVASAREMRLHHANDLLVLRISDGTLVGKHALCCYGVTIPCLDMHEQSETLLTGFGAIL